MAYRKYTYRTPEGPHTVEQLSTADMVALLLQTERGRALWKRLPMPPDMRPTSRATAKKRVLTRASLAIVRALLTETIVHNNSYALPSRFLEIRAARLQGRGEYARLVMKVDRQRATRWVEKFFRGGNGFRITPGTDWFHLMQDTMKTVKYRKHEL